MQKKIVLFPYNSKSKSGKTLAQGLGILRVKRKDSVFIPREGDIILNWGSSSCNYAKGTIINTASAVALASNKLLTFRRLFDCSVPTPDYKLSLEDAQYWVDQGNTVYGRQTLTGSQGQGIIIFNEDNPVVTLCPLYTKATKAKLEYRVHILDETVIDFVQKKRKLNFQGGTTGIRNHTNGWVFARQEVVLPAYVKEVAINAVKALGLRFGAVDIGYTPETNSIFVYEVNTAPGIEGTTISKYLTAFKTKLGLT